MSMDVFSAALVRIALALNAPERASRHGRIPDADPYLGTALADAPAGSHLSQPVISAIVGEYLDWDGHSPEEIQAKKMRSQGSSRSMTAGYGRRGKEG